jgi:hypothetical protein
MSIERIYFGHHTKTYNTEYELDCINKIKELHPGCTITNPKDLRCDEACQGNPGRYSEFMEQMEMCYFPALVLCNVLVVAKTKNRKISPGVQKEIEFALAHGIKVEYLDVVFPKINRPTKTCYFCGLQFVVEDEEANGSSIRSDYSMKDEEDIWRDSCSHCNGIDGE